MGLWEILVLAVVQGLTEFLPISSSGHLVIASSLFPDSVALDADDVIEVPRPTGDLLYVREFSGADQLHDWPELHDPAVPEVAFGYHAPDVFHIEVRSPLQVAVASGTVQPDNTIVSADVELRRPEQPVDGFRYGLIANANSTGSLTFTIQDILGEGGQRTLRWCVRRGSELLVAPGLNSAFITVPEAPCEAAGEMVVADIRNRLGIGFTEREAQFFIGDQLVAQIDEVRKEDSTFGFVVENTQPSLISHAHFDNLTVISI